MAVGSRSGRQLFGDVGADEGRRVQPGQQRHGVEDAHDREPLAVHEDPWSGREVRDAEALRGCRWRTIAGYPSTARRGSGRRAPCRAVDGGQEAGVRGEHPDSVGLGLRHQVGATDGGRHRATTGLDDRTDPADMATLVSGSCAPVPVNDCPGRTSRRLVPNDPAERRDRRGWRPRSERGHERGCRWRCRAPSAPAAVAHGHRPRRGEDVGESHPAAEPGRARRASCRLRSSSTTRPSRTRTRRARWPRSRGRG